LSRLARRRSALLAAGLVALGAVGAGASIARRAGYLGGLKSAPPLVVSSAPVSTITDTLKPRETLSQLFERRGVGDVDWAALARSVRDFQPSRARAGLVFVFRQRHGEAAPFAAVARVSPEERLRIARGVGGWSASVEAIPFQVVPLLVRGTIPADGNLYDALDEVIGDDVLPRGERTQLAWDLADVYDWEIDFSRDLQPGDRFRVVAERLVSADGESRYGRVLAARIDNAGTRLYAFRYDDGDRPEFWDERGRSLRRDFLRAPLRFKRVSSRFSHSRWQPILRYYRAHLGTDFAAAMGTEVRTVGDGTVIFAGREGDYGNLVEIRHPTGVETRYGHLSAFAPGLRAGVHVTQGDVIGYVGATGLATGPHLHYEVRVHGRAVRPSVVLGVGAGVPIATSRRADFEQERARLTAMLEPDRPPAIARTD
jgi:murein DD-endopeptidase MepM/ murein hydrolase activator NlpD